VDRVSTIRLRVRDDADYECIEDELSDMPEVVEVLGLESGPDDSLDDLALDAAWLEEIIAVESRGLAQQLHRQVAPLDADEIAEELDLIAESLLAANVSDRMWLAFNVARAAVGRLRDATTNAATDAATETRRDAATGEEVPWSVRPVSGKV